MASTPSPPPATATLPLSPRKPPPLKPLLKDLHFNDHHLSASKKMQAGVDLAAKLLGLTLGPKGRNVVLENKYGPPKIVNDGETILKQIELEDPLENLGVKLVRQAGAKTNDVAGDGCTTSVILAQGIIAEGMKMLAAGLNPVQVSRGIEKTAIALVSELRRMSRKIEDHEIAAVATVSAGSDSGVGAMIAEALRRVGRDGVVRIEDGRSTDTALQVVEGMQFDRGYLSPHFVTDRQSMTAELSDCKILLVDSKIKNARAMSKILNSAVREKFPLLIICEAIEEQELAPIIGNKLKGAIKVAVVKAPAFGARKTDCMEDIAILTGGVVVRDDKGYTLEKAGKEFLGSAAKAVITRDSTLIVTDGSTQDAVRKRAEQIRALAENSAEKSQKKILNERAARLCSGIAVIQVGAQTVVELNDKKLRVEDALNATKAAIEEGVVVGGGCSLLRLSERVDTLKESFGNEDQKIGADIFKRALRYPSMLIARNAGVNGSLIVSEVLSCSDMNYGYNAAENCCEDLVAAGILDPAKVVRCCIEHAASVARAFLTCDVAVVESKENEPPRLFRPPRPTPEMFNRMSSVLRRGR